MPFLLATARTIQLKREINSKHYEQTLIAMQLEEATKKVSEKQEAINDMKNNFQNYTSCFSTWGQNMAATALLGQDTNHAVSDGSKITDWSAMSYVMQQGTSAGAAMQKIAQSIFDNTTMAQQKTELARLQAQESTLNLRKTSLDTELNLLEEEYKAYKDQASKDVQDAVPHFGLA